MWEILGALFGGTYLSGKLSCEKNASKEAAKKREAWKRYVDTWTYNVTDVSLEESTETFVEKNPEEAAKKATDICPCIPQDQNNPKMYSRILLAVCAKIPKHDALLGITPHFYHPGDMSVVEVREKYRAFYNFMVWYEQELRKNDIKERIVFIPAYPAPDEKEYFYLDDTEKILRYGRFEWEPQRITHYLENKAGR